MEPCWLLFRPNKGGEMRGLPLFCCVAFLNRFFFDFFAHGPMGYPSLSLDFGWFLIHFGAKLALTWATWPQALALDGLVGLREALRIFQEINFQRNQKTKPAQDGFKTAQDSPKTAPRRPQDAPRRFKTTSQETHKHFYNY